MSDRDPFPPGPLRDEKRSEQTSDPGHPQPEAAEVESARLLANETHEDLARAGLDRRQVRRLANRFIAEDRGQAPEDFIRWAKARPDLAD